MVARFFFLRFCARVMRTSAGALRRIQDLGMRKVSAPNGHLWGGANDGGGGICMINARGLPSPLAGVMKRLRGRWESILETVGAVGLNRLKNFQKPLYFIIFSTP